MKKLLFIIAAFVMIFACASGASAATITIDVTPTPPSITASDGNDYSGTIWVPASDKILIPASLAAHDFVITGTSPTVKRHIDIQGMGAGDPGTFPITDFNVTVKDLTISVTENGTQIGDFSGGTTISGIVIRKNANVDMYVENFLHIEKITRGQNTGLIHIGENNDKDNPGRNSLFIHGDGMDKTTVTLDVDKYVERNGGGCDALRANQRCTVYAKDLTLKGINTPDSNRAFALNNNDAKWGAIEPITFENCIVQLVQGRPLASYGTERGPDLHFINSTLKLEGTDNGNSPIQIPGATITFCNNRTNSALIDNSKGNHATIWCDKIKVSGGAIEITNSYSDTGTGIKTNTIEFVLDDDWGHPVSGQNEDIIFYVDKLEGTPVINAEKGIKAIISETTTAGSELQTKDYWATGLGSTGFNKTGNVWGEFELFNARDDIPDYVIHDREQIIVQYDPDNPNTLTIAKDAELTIQDGGRLVIEQPDGNINDGVIVLEPGTKTKEEIQKIIQDWGFTGTGIIKVPGIGVFDNSGAMWGDIVDKTPASEKSKLTGGPNLVVMDKDEDGDTILAAVNPKKEDEAYLVKPNRALDLKLFITDPVDTTKLSDAYDPKETAPGSGIIDPASNNWISSLVYPLKDDGTPYDLNEPGAPAPLIGPTPRVKIESSTADFSLSVDDVRDLREYAKANNVDSFVIWVYQTESKDSENYKAGGIKMPFVFKVDSPQHTLQEVVDSGKVQKEQIVEGQNLLVFDSVAQSGSVPTAEFVAINPTRDEMLADLHIVKAGNGLALDVYVAAKAGEVPIDKGSTLENAQVKASLRPYDGLTPEQYRGLNDFVLTKGPHRITEGFVDFEYDYLELYRWARLHRVNEFVIYIYDVDDDGRMLANGVSREFIFRIEGVDTDIHGSHCSGCDAGAGIGAAAAALAFIATRKKRSR